MSRYHGRRGRVYLSTTGTGTAIPVVSLSSWSLDMSTDKVDVTSFDDTTKTYVQGLPDISGRFEGSYNDAEATLMAARTSADGCKIYLYASLDAATKYAYGVAWLDVSISVSVSDAAKVSASFAAASSWGVNL